MSLRVVLAGALLAGALAGCGDPTESYCSALSDRQQEFAEMTGGTGAGLVGHLPMLRDLADEAPDDLTDEWQTFVNAIEAFAAALDRAGIDPDEVTGADDLAALPQDQRAAVAGAANELAAADVVEAATGIEQHAKDVCKIQLGLG